MRCRPNDLVVVVACKIAPENIGAVRVVTRLAGCWLGWELDRPLPNGDDCICDTCLQPIRPGPVDIDIDIPDYSDLHLEPTP